MSHVERGRGGGADGVSAVRDRERMGWMIAWVKCVMLERLRTVLVQFCWLELGYRSCMYSLSGALTSGESIELERR